MPTSGPSPRSRRDIAAFFEREDKPSIANNDLPSLQPLQNVLLGIGGHLVRILQNFVLAGVNNFVLADFVVTTIDVFTSVDVYT
jgi:hypothetical protein